MSLAEPRTIGRYALHGEIASGGMATVHLGRLLGQVGFSRTVAIKRLHPQFAKDPDFVSMFVEEARLAGRIRHPNVVSTLDVVYDGDELLLVLDFVLGESLARLIRASYQAKAPIPIPIVLGIVIGALEGLHAAHEAKSERGEPLGIVHRDISPQNILVGNDGVARVLDFGVAKATRRSQQTRAGMLKGKVAYMPPEQLKGGVVDRRSDIYAASVVLWETLTNYRLFDGEDDFQIAHKILSEEIDPPSRLRPDIPTMLDAVVLHGLERDAHDRFASALDMIAALESIDRVASSREIGRWMEQLVGPQLRTRANQVTEVESLSQSASPSRPPGPNPFPVAEPAPAPALVAPPPPPPPPGAARGAPVPPPVGVRPPTPSMPAISGKPSLAGERPTTLGVPRPTVAQPRPAAAVPSPPRPSLLQPRPGNPPRPTPSLAGAAPGASPEAPAPEPVVVNAPPEPRPSPSAPLKPPIPAPPSLLRAPSHPDLNAPGSLQRNIPKNTMQVGAFKAPSLLRENRPPVAPPLPVAPPSPAVALAAPPEAPVADEPVAPLPPPVPESAETPEPGQASGPGEGPDAATAEPAAEPTAAEPATTKPVVVTAGVTEPEGATLPPPVPSANEEATLPPGPMVLDGERPAEMGLSSPGFLASATEPPSPEGAPGYLDDEPDEIGDAPTLMFRSEQAVALAMQQAAMAGQEPAVPPVAPPSAPAVPAASLVGEGGRRVAGGETGGFSQVANLAIESPPDEPAPAPRSRKPLIAAAAAGLVLLAVVVFKAAGPSDPQPGKTGVDPTPSAAVSASAKSAEPSAQPPPDPPPTDTVKQPDPPPTASDPPANSTPPTSKKAPKPPVKNCNPPYTIDKRGIKRLKPECI